MSDEQNKRLEAREDTDTETAECPAQAEVERLAVERDSAVNMSRDLALEKEVAESKAATYATQMGLAEKRAREADEVSAQSAFGFYLVLGILVALLLVFVLWMLASPGRDTAVIVRPGIAGIVKNILLLAFPALLSSVTVGNLKRR